MSLLKIARMGHPPLREPADAVREPADPEVQRLIADMIETLADAGGIGLAAPQVHTPWRILIFRVPAARLRRDATRRGGTHVPERERREGVPMTVLINPGFEPLDTRQDEGWEGCLSIPDLIGKVPRYRHIRYWGQDAAGQPVSREAHGLHARVVQHEIDHLDGVLYPERMVDLATLAFSSEIPTRDTVDDDAAAA
jgi:peptide deformylase